MAHIQGRTEDTFHRILTPCSNLRYRAVGHVNFFVDH